MTEGKQERKPREHRGYRCPDLGEMMQFVPERFRDLPQVGPLGSQLPDITVGEREPALVTALHLRVSRACPQGESAFFWTPSLGDPRNLHGPQTTEL